MSNTNTETENKKFWTEVSYRFKAPWTAIFVAYFLVLIIGGSMGVFFTVHELYKSDKISSENFKIAEGLATFFIAIIATAFIDLNVCKDINNKKAFMVWSYLLGFFALFLLWLTYQFKNVHSFWPSGLGTIVALSMWIIANADNEKIIKEDSFFDEMRGKEKHTQSWNQ